MPSQLRIADRLRQHRDRISKAEVAIGMASVGPKRKILDTGRIVQRCDEIDAGISGLFEAVNVAPLRATSENVLDHRAQQAASTATHLGGEARIKSLATALTAIARERGAWLAELDALQSAVVEHAPESDREFWAQPASAARIYALILNEPALAALLKTHNVVVFGAAADRRVRIVDGAWL